MTPVFNVYGHLAEGFQELQKYQSKYLTVATQRLSQSDVVV